MSQNPRLTRVFIASLLSFMTLIAPIAAMGSIATFEAVDATSYATTGGSPNSITATDHSDAAFSASTTSRVFSPTVLPPLNLTANTLGDEADLTLNGVCDTDSVTPGDQCTLRAAIQEANSNPDADTISFSLAPNSTITLTSELDDIDGDLVITGPASGVTVSGDTFYRIFTVLTGNTVSISNLAIADGQSSAGGGGIHNSGNLTISRSTFTGNQAVGRGAGIDNAGNLTISDSTFTGNQAEGQGGGIYNVGNLRISNSTFTANQAVVPAEGGAIYSDEGTLTANQAVVPAAEGGAIYSDEGALTIINSTISGNSSDGDGGGVLNCGNSTATLINVTITNNRANADGVAPGSGGGIGQVSSNPITLHNAIVVGNFVGMSPETTPDDISGTMDTSSSYNLIGIGGSGGLTGVNENQVGVADALLAPLANNGGPTQTHRLLPGSPAIDKGKNLATDENNNPILTDQRGGFRPVDLDDTPYPNATGGDASDIGAYELQGDTVQSGTSLIVNTADDHDDEACTDGDCTLREAIIAANSDSGATITFDIPGAGPHIIQLVEPLDDLETDMNIQGPTDESVVVRGESIFNPYGIFTIIPGPVVSISNLTISDGFDVFFGGGGILNFGSLTIDNMTFTNNFAEFGGAIDNEGSLNINNSTFTDNLAAVGGAVFNAGLLNLENSTFTRNYALEDGGAIDSDDGNLIIVNSTISGNSADGDGGGLFQCGGCGSTTAVLTNVTITDNRADADGDEVGVGGGISNFGGVLTLRNTIVAGNFNGESPSTTPDDIDGLMDPASSYNLIGLGGSGGLVDSSVDPAHGNQVGVANPGLGPLQNNGGPTLTHALLPGSPAFNAAIDMTSLNGAIDDSQTSFDVFDASGIPNCVGFPIRIDDEEMLVTCYSGNTLMVTRGFNGTTPAAHSTGAGVNPRYDQRGTGFPRVVFFSVDIGAFEVQPQPGTPHHLAFDVQPSDSIAGATITPALTVLILDGGNNLTTSTANVTLSIGTNPGAGTLSGTTTVAAVNGTATFSDLSIDKIGSGYTLTAVSAGLVNTTSIPFNITSPASISGTKTVSGGFTPGSTVTYTIVLSNGSSSTQLDNPGNEFSDVLPSGLTLVSASATSGTATTGANTVSWNGSIAGGGSVTITITATINNVPGGTTISNQGTINYDADGNGTNEATSVTDDPSVGGASDATSFTVTSPANVSGTKTKAGGTTPGSTVTYTVVLSNGNSFTQLDNPGNEFIDVLPSSLTLVSASATSGTATTGGNTVSWNGSIAGGGSVTITINATINNVPGGTTVSNQGTIRYDADGNGTNEATSVTDDPSVGGASDPTSFTVTSPANVSGTKTKAGGTTPASTVTYTVVLSNGSSLAQLDNPGNEFTDVLPASLNLVSASATSGTATANIGTNTVSWNGSIAGNGSVTITITATINNVPDGTLVSNQGTINYDADGNGTNEASRLTDDTAVGGASDPTNFTVVSNPDLTITKSHAGNFSQGEAGASYTITVTNSGTGTTSGVVTVTDNVPVGLTPTGPNGLVNGWSCSINGQTLTCTRGDVLAGGASYQDIILTVNVANPAPLSVTNTATVSASGEINTSNNSASDPTVINCSQDFSLNNGSPLMISRFRMNGPGGPQDEFVEIYNPGTTAHTVASGNCAGGGYGVYASAGNGTTSNSISLACQIPNGTVIPAGGYYLCTGATYSLGNLGRNGGAAGATSVGDAPIGCGGQCTADIPNDAGLALINLTQGVIATATGFISGIPEDGFIVYDKVGVGPYGPGAPAPQRPSLADNFCEGACLQPVGDGSVMGQYELLRRQTGFDPNLGTLHQDTNNNAADFIFISPNPGINPGLNITGISGVTAVLGAAGPQGSIGPPDAPATKLTRAPFDGVDQLGPRNAERDYGLDPAIVNPANNPVGTFTLRFRYTNNSGAPIKGLRFKVDNLSTLCGPQTSTATVGTGNARNLSSTPDCGTGSFTAILKLLNSATEVIVDSGGIARTVNGTVLEDLSAAPTPPGASPLSPNGGGVDNSVIVNPSSASASVGDSVNGGTGNFGTAMGTSGPTNLLRIKVKFGVVRSGRFILLITPMAKTGSPPAP